MVQDVGAAPGWKHVGCSTAASPYLGWASGDRKPEDGQGVFAAAFFELAA